MNAKKELTPVPSDGIKRVIIKDIFPSVAGGKYPAKGEENVVISFKATIIADGHDKIFAEVLVRYQGEKSWARIALEPKGNDRWEADYTPVTTGLLEFKMHAWVSELDSWKDAYRKKHLAGTDTQLDALAGVALLGTLLPLAAKAERKEIEQLLSEKRASGLSPDDLDPVLFRKLLGCAAKERITSSAVFNIDIERKKAGFSTWYELFPRSCAAAKEQHGTFVDVIRQLPRLAAMGFDVLYLPPIHPIGRMKRKGKNNSPIAGSDDPGSPWAIGSEEGGHKAIHPELGTMDDFKQLIREANQLGIEVAMDIAFQCAPDHPYVQQHPEWFKTRADGSIQFAENPPKKYEDIVPFDFESVAWPALWQELLSIFQFWIDKGIKIFRVDNPHTKPLRFWEWVIAAVRKQTPDVIFLAEAFTRPHIMEHLAMTGFSQSYTYFTWRNTKQELEDYVKELTGTHRQYYFRPNFWPNTPDILPEHLVTGGENMHIIRLLLAATLSSNYGIYGPVYERGINVPTRGKEEYTDNEKYEIKYWEPTAETRTERTIKKVNAIRNQFKALQQTRNIRFLETSNDKITAFLKYSREDGLHMLVVINLDANHKQSCWLHIPKAKLQATEESILVLKDQLNDEEYTWTDAWNYVELAPESKPAHIFSLKLLIMPEAP